MRRTTHAATTTPATPESRCTTSSTGSVLNRPNRRPSASVAPGACVTRNTPTNPAAYSHATFLSIAIVISRVLDPAKNRQADHGRRHHRRREDDGRRRVTDHVAHESGRR